MYALLLRDNLWHTTSNDYLDNLGNSNVVRAQTLLRLRMLYRGFSTATTSRMSGYLQVVYCEVLCCGPPGCLLVGAAPLCACHDVAVAG
jgi:hypothetical protein